MKHKHTIILLTLVGLYLFIIGGFFFYKKLVDTQDPLIGSISIGNVIKVERTPEARGFMFYKAPTTRVITDRGIDIIIPRDIYVKIGDSAWINKYPGRKLCFCQETFLDYCPCYYP